MALDWSVVKRSKRSVLHRISKNVPSGYAAFSGLFHLSSIVLRAGDVALKPINETTLPNAILLNDTFAITGDVPAVQSNADQIIELDG